MLATAVALASVLLATLASFAQQPAIRKNEFSIWGAQSFANGHAFGFAQDRTLSFLALRYGRSLGELAGINFRYMVEVRPVAVLGDLRPASAAPRRTYTYAAGLSPIGLQITPLARRRAHPFFASNGGFLYFARAPLDPRDTNFQFTVYIAGGAEVAVSPTKSIKFGYMYHHFSDANIGYNLALDTHTVFAGFSWYR